jgi:hypothetical protein
VRAEPAKPHAEREEYDNVTQRVRAEPTEPHAEREEYDNVTQHARPNRPNLTRSVRSTRMSAGKEALCHIGHSASFTRPISNFIGR